MQAMYALKQSETANYHNALGYVEEVFTPNLNSMEKPDLKLLEQKKQRAASLFENHFKKSPTENGSEEADISKTVSDALSLYRKQVEKDKKYFGKMLQKEIEGIFESYILCLSFLDRFTTFSEENEESQSGKKNRSENKAALNKNSFIEMLRKSKEYISNTKGGKLVWNNDIIRKAYKNAIKNDEELKTYLLNNNRSFEAEQAIILHIAKSILFKDAAVQTFFEEKDLNWGENKSIVKNMVLKTLKGANENQKELELLEISANWEEDRVFYEELYRHTSEKQEKLEEIVSERIENWDIERLAAIDRIILVMAISEMINFPSIPVKVSINEYIELSKIYSTPKSKQFINGILDRLAEDLSKAGMIRKSGRGLIDNK